jgi:hypothetical protein
MSDGAQGITVDQRVNNPLLFGGIGAVGGGMLGSILADFRDIRRRHRGEGPVNRNAHVIGGSLLGALLLGLSSKSMGPGVPGTVLRSPEDLETYMDRWRQQAYGKPEPKELKSNIET